MHIIEFRPDEKLLTVKDWETNTNRHQTIFENHVPSIYKFKKADGIEIFITFMYTVYCSKYSNEYCKQKILIQMLGDYPYASFIHHEMNMWNKHLNEPIPSNALLQEFVLWMDKKGLQQIYEDYEIANQKAKKALTNINKYIVN